MTDGDSENKFTHESFGAIASETRMEILRELWFQRALTFSELFDRVDVDDSGQFTYHLNKLLDHFVRKSGDRYKLTVSGTEIITTILAHAESENPLRSPYELDTDCYSCGSAIHAVSSGGWLRIDCDSCGKVYASFPIPVAGLRNRSPDEFLAVFDQRLRRMNALVHRGICPNCSSPMDRKLVPDAEPEPGLPFVFNHRCEHCRLEIFTLPGTGLLEHPAIVSFYDRHDVDLFAIPHWELEWLFDGDCIAVVSETPLEYTIDVAVNDERLRATLGENARVIETEVTPTPSSGRTD